MIAQAAIYTIAILTGRKQSGTFEPIELREDLGHMTSESRISQKSLKCQPPPPIFQLPHFLLHVPNKCNLSPPGKK